MSLQNLFVSSGIGGSDYEIYDLIVGVGGDHLTLAAACAAGAINAKIWVKDNTIETTDIIQKPLQKVHSCGRIINFNGNSRRWVIGNTGYLTTAGNFTTDNNVVTVGSTANMVAGGKICYLNSDYSINQIINATSFRLNELYRGKTATGVRFFTDHLVNGKIGDGCEVIGISVTGSTYGSHAIFINGVSNGKFFFDNIYGNNTPNPVDIGAYVVNSIFYAENIRNNTSTAVGQYGINFASSTNDASCDISVFITNCNNNFSTGIYAKENNIIVGNVNSNYTGIYFGNSSTSYAINDIIAKVGNVIANGNGIRAFDPAYGSISVGNSYINTMTGVQVSGCSNIFIGNTCYNRSSNLTLSSASSSNRMRIDVGNCCELSFTATFTLVNSSNIFRRSIVRMGRVENLTTNDLYAIDIDPSTGVLFSVGSIINNGSGYLMSDGGSNTVYNIGSMTSSGITDYDAIRVIEATLNIGYAYVNSMQAIPPIYTDYVRFNACNLISDVGSISKAISVGQRSTFKIAYTDMPIFCLITPGYDMFLGGTYNSINIVGVGMLRTTLVCCRWDQINDTGTNTLRDTTIANIEY